MDRKFLTVFAVFDLQTQSKLKLWQDAVLKKGNCGTQTMDIPFHISLGSFPIECEQELILRIKDICSKKNKFKINLQKVNKFGNSVLFVQPENSEELFYLHSLFDNNYPNGFEWHAHATIFCGEDEEVLLAENVLNGQFEPFTATVTSIAMGEFFPTRMIIDETLL